MSRLRYAVLLTVPLLLLGTAAVIVSQRSTEQRYEATTTVLESPEHGPELCLGGVLTSLPPQCGSVPVVGWDWKDVPDEESRAGTTWVEARVEGTYDGERFTLTAPPGPPERPRQEPYRYPPACDDPTVVDASDGSDEFAGRAYADVPELVAVWVNDDQSPEWDGPFTLNIAVRPGNAQEAEARVREHWGGYLCVVERDQPTAKELDDVLERLPDVLTQPLLVGDANHVRGVVEAKIIVVDEQARREVEDGFEEGLVELTGALRPVP